MQRFERGSVMPPAFLLSEEVVQARFEINRFLFLEPTQRSQTAAPTSDVVLDNDNVMQALSTLFRGKCAFCERLHTDLQPYRFRPVADALPMARAKDQHLYYSWLSLAWENIYPICRECTPHRPDYFPVVGSRISLPDRHQLISYVSNESGLWGDYPLDEKSVLLDPCFEHSFHKHLHVTFEGKVKPLSLQGEITIQCFWLDRPELEPLRAKRLQEYFGLLLSRGFNELREDNSPPFEGLDFANLEFGGLWYLQCRTIAQFFTSKLHPISDEDLRPECIGETFALIARAPYFAVALEKLRGRVIRTSHGCKLRLTQERGKWARFRGRNGVPPVEYPALYAVAIKNFKSIEGLRLELNQSAHLLPGQAPALLILGENSSGKSSILEGVTLALAQEDDRRALEINTGTLTLDTSLLGGAQKKRVRTARVTLSFQGAEDRVLRIAKGVQGVSGIVSTPPVFAYGAFRQYLNTNTLDAAPPGSIVNLFYPNRFLLNPETWLLSLNSYAFDRVVQVLRIIFSIDSDFAFLLRDKRRRRCLLVTNGNDGKPAGKTPLQLASSGYRSLLAMVCDILRGLMDPDISPDFQSFPTAQAVVLIDEVEAHLHPRWKIRVMSALREALPRVTFIATSHDPLCLRGMHNGEVVVMRRRVDDVGLSMSVECLSDLPDVGKLTIEQLLTSDFFNLMTTDQPDMAFQLAHIADLLAKQSAGTALSTEESVAVKAFEGELGSALPIGGTEAQRLVQEAVAQFLKARASESANQMTKLRNKYRDEIIDILERF